MGRLPPATFSGSGASREPAPAFHILQYTYASALAMKGVSMRVIADQLGHADTRVTERHYARLAPSYVADGEQATLPAMGIMDTASPIVRHARVSNRIG